MEVYHVSFVGQGVIRDEHAMQAVLEDFAARLIREKEYVEFLVGRENRFDDLATSAIRRAQSKHGAQNSCLTLSLPCTIAQNDFFRAYDGVVYAVPLDDGCDTVQNHRRAMLSRSELVVGYTTENSGEVYHALKYAAEKGKKVKNLAAMIYTPTPEISLSKLKQMYGKNEQKCLR